ncbi:tRNA ligase [Plectosphaerella cucumerina]|uniref:tRNA ligase n=1 Tax=Plectosphaerella cucumerina TaxID=40658 RepID=A0A8K0TK28_9PEZI|nr:tRNA ligase [Plectosphaerella cucumerina]
MATPTTLSGSKVPYVEQDVREVAEMLRALEETKKDKRKGGFVVKKTTYDVKKSTDRIRVDSWKMPMESDYKKRNLPTYARGLFTTKNRRNEPEIVARGYDKFFNTGEVHETKWENIFARTQGPYELTLKENGCIIFLSGLEDGTLLVCSKHSTGERDDAELSHAIAGERLVEKQLAALGRTAQDLAVELRNRNATAVAELCDDSFEEHVLAYGPDKAGLYLHGINLNLPTFATYPSAEVQNFADAWGFKKVDLKIMDDIHEVKKFLDEVAESGAHDGRDVEGFVIRCRESYNPEVQPYRDWFFKYKFEEPYLMYRQWRECTKAMISGKTPKFKKHIQITEEYLLYARKRLHEDPNLGALYQANHGIIGLRDDFLAFKNMKGSEAANLEVDGFANVDDSITRDVILVPIATIGCGKTTIAIALTKLFLWGHVQNDNIQGKGRPPRFTKQVLDLLQDHPVVIADRNNAQKHERKQILTDVKLQHKDARLVALYFDHSDTNIDDVRKVTQARVIARGDNHQTIHAASNQDKFLGIMEGFIDRFEPLRTFSPPDDGFDNVIRLDPTADSRQNLETTLKELHHLYPALVREVPSAERLDAVIQETIGDYQPTLKHTIPERGPRKQKVNHQQANKGPKKKKPLEYMSVDVASHEIRSLLDKTFDAAGMPLAKFYKQLSQTRRIQPKFHVTLMHRASSKEHPELWDRYCKIHAEAEAASEGLLAVPTLGACGVELERVVFDERVMAIVVRISDQEGQGWECINPIAHITVGTANDAIKPRESNDLLQKWNTEGTEGNGIHDIVFENKVFIEGTVSAVLSR